jgi:uncharacterized protein
MFIKSKLLIISFTIILTACSNFKDRNNSQGQIINGKKEGIWKIYDSTGALKEISNYKHDTLNGLRITFYENGETYTNAHYKMGVFVDSFFLYFKNGQVQVESWFDPTGHEQGLYKIYYENGKLRQIGHDINNQYDDTIKTFYDNGQLMYLEYYKNGKKEGVFTTFDEHGNSIKQEYFKKDSLLNEKFLNSSQH